MYLIRSKKKKKKKVVRVRSFSVNFILGAKQRKKGRRKKEKKIIYQITFKVYPTKLYFAYDIT